MNEFRYGALEFRETDDGLGVVVGTVMRYGDVAQIGPNLTESFNPGAFGDYSSPRLKVNRMHQRTQVLARLGGRLEIDNNDERMLFQVSLPDTSVGRDTAIEIREGLLTGASVEFRDAKDNVEAGHRAISAATLAGFGIVDEPAYPGSVASMRWDEYRAEHGLVVPEPEPVVEPVVEPVSTRYFLMV